MISLSRISVLICVTLISYEFVSFIFGTVFIIIPFVICFESVTIIILVPTGNGDVFGAERPTPDECKFSEEPAAAGAATACDLDATGAGAGAAARGAGAMPRAGRPPDGTTCTGAATACA